MLSGTIRDPFRSVLEDWAGTMDPFSAELFPLAGGMSNLGRGRTSRGGVGRLMTVDCFEDANGFNVICEIPGVTKDKIDLNVDNKILSIRCNKASPDYCNCNLSRTEILYGSDVRTLRIPNNCAEEPSCCCYKDGVLQMVFPKVAEQEGKKLRIETS